MLDNRILIKGCWIVIVLMALFLFANIRFEVFPFNIMPVTRSKGDVRLLSYNVKSRSVLFNRHISDIGDLVLEIRPDFVFFTEYEGATNDALKDRLESVYPFVYDEHRQLPYQSDIMFSKWEIDTVRNYPLTGHYYSLYRVQIHKDKDTMAVYCCHLSSNNLELDKGRFASLNKGRDLRLKEAETIVEALNAERFPVVIIGDMNDVNSSEALRKLNDAGLNDAWWAGGFGYGSTFGDGLLYLRIDHAFYDNKYLELKSISTEGDYSYSDHKALVVSFKFIR